MVQHIADPDVDVVALREDVPVARSAVDDRSATHIVDGIDVAQRLTRRLLHHVERDRRVAPAGVEPEPPRDDAVHAVGGNHDRRRRTVRPSRAVRLTPCASCDAATMSTPSTSSAPASHASDDQQRVELDAANHQRRRHARLDDGRIAAGPFQVKARDLVGRNPRQRALQVRKTREHTQADSAAARLVPGELRPIEQADGYTGRRERPRRRRSRRASHRRPATCIYFGLMRLARSWYAPSTPAGSSRQRPRPTYTQRPLP